MFIVKTDSGMFMPSVPHKTFKSFVRAVNTMERAVEKRAAEYGYEIHHYLTWEENETTFVVSYKDCFGFLHAFTIEEIEDE
jgi:hypothetical protein